MGNIGTVLLSAIIISVSMVPLTSTWGLPISDPKIDHHHVGLRNKTTGFVSIWVCPKCHPGMGPSVECGRIYDIETDKVDCVPCQEGISFSPNYDRGQCRPCRKCSDNENQTGECTAEKDSVTCKCKPGYYRETILTNDCKPCSYCCDDKSNKYEPDCNIQQVSAERRCSFQYDNHCSPTVKTTNSTNATSKGASTATPLNQTTPKSIMPFQKSTENSISPTMPEPKEKNKTKHSKHILTQSFYIAILCFFTFVFGFIMISLVPKLYRRGKQSNTPRSMLQLRCHFNRSTERVQMFIEQEERETGERSMRQDQVPPTGQPSCPHDALNQPANTRDKENERLMANEREPLICQDQAPPPGQPSCPHDALNQPANTRDKENERLMANEREPLICQDQPPEQPSCPLDALNQPANTRAKENERLMANEREPLICQDQPPGQPSCPLDALNQPANPKDKENERLMANEKKSLICQKFGPKVDNIPYDVQCEVCSMLNVKQSVRGNDYRSVASNPKIGMKPYEVGNLARQDNPMEGVFQVMNSLAKTVTDFVDILYEVKRYDVVDQMYEMALAVTRST